MRVWRETTLLEAEHPSLAGHFPGNPLAPGVLLLDRVMQAVARGWPRYRVSGLPQAKFVHPWRPGEHLDIVLEKSTPGRLSFVCQHAGQPVAHGLLNVEINEDRS
ncbi:MAG: hydroxymyristoyl-ACP dehydratase [Pseudomonadota bacterium]|jgi:3-hydroxymyristoyl/3-hydroxydecanoyl-(acyl carrier protein) dehydratase